MSYDNPDYYKGKYGLEAIEVIKNFFEHNAYLATVFPYLARLGKKDSVIQDLDKAIWWLKTYRKHLVDTGTYDPKTDKAPFPEVTRGKNGTYTAEGFNFTTKINPGAASEHIGVESSCEGDIKSLEDDYEEKRNCGSLADLSDAGAAKKIDQPEKATEEIAADTIGGNELPKMFIGLLPQTVIGGTFNRFGMASGVLLNQNGAFGIDKKGEYFGGKVGVSTGAVGRLRDQISASDILAGIIHEGNAILHDSIMQLADGASITFGGERYEKIGGVFTCTHTSPEGDKHIQPKDMLSSIVKSGSSASVDYGSMVDYFSLCGLDVLTESERVVLLDVLPNSTRLYCDGWCGEYNYIKFGMGWLPAGSMTFVTNEDIAISAEALMQLNTPKAIFAALEALPEGVRVKRNDNSKDYIDFHKHEGQTIMRKHDNDMFRSLDEMLRDLLMLNHEYRICRGDAKR